MYVFTKEDENKIENIVRKYPVKQSALLPLLTLVQRRDGYKADCLTGYFLTIFSILFSSSLVNTYISDRPLP
jgi:NADH:ubiquinone oxidoreductase subunit E